MNYTKASQTLSYLLQNLADLEKESELHRAVLSNKNTLNLASAFHYIDYRHKGKIKPGDIRLFMEENGVNISNNDIGIIFNCLDSNRNGEIDWKEFQRFFLNTDFLELPQKLGSPTISKEVAGCLIDLMECELKGYNGIEKLKENLKKEINFKPEEYFNKLDTFSKGFLDVRDIYDFLAQNTDSITYKKAERVMKRIDGHSSGRVTPEKWKQLFLRQAPAHIRNSKPAEPVVRKTIRITDNVQTRPKSRDRPLIKLKEVKNIDVELPKNNSRLQTPTKYPIKTVKKTVVEEKISKPRLSNSRGNEQRKVIKKRITTTTTVKENPTPPPTNKKKDQKKNIQLKIPPKSSRVRRTTITTTTTSKEKKPKPSNSAMKNIRGKQLLDRFLHSQIHKPVTTSGFQTKNKFRRQATPDRRINRVEFKRRSPSQPQVSMCKQIYEKSTALSQVLPQTVVHEFSPTQVNYHPPRYIEQPPAAVSMVQATSPILVQKQVPRISRPSFITKNRVLFETSRSPPRNLEPVPHNPSPLRRRVESKLTYCSSPQRVEIIRNSKVVMKENKFIEEVKISPNNYRVRESRHSKEYQINSNGGNQFVTLGKRDSPSKNRLNCSKFLNNNSNNNPKIIEEQVRIHHHQERYNPLNNFTMDLSPDFNQSNYYNKKSSHKEKNSPSIKHNNVLKDLKHNTLRDYHKKFDSSHLPPKGKSSTKERGYCNRLRDNSPSYATPDKTSRCSSKRSKKMKKDYNDIVNYNKIKRTNDRFQEKYGKRKTLNYKRSPYYKKFCRDDRKSSKEPNFCNRKPSFTKLTKLGKKNNRRYIEEYSVIKKPSYHRKTYTQREISDEKKVTKINLETEDYQENSFHSVVSQEESRNDEKKRLKIKSEFSLDKPSKLKHRVIEEKKESPRKREKTLIFDRYNPEYKSKIPELLEGDDVEEVSVTKTVHTAKGIMKKIVTTKKLPNGEIIVTEKLLQPESESVQGEERDEYEYSKYGREFGDSVEKRRNRRGTIGGNGIRRRRRTYTTSSPVDFKYINPRNSKE